MQVKDLIFKNRIQHELIRATYDDSNKSWPAGLFDYELKLLDLDNEEIDILAEWLSENCRENFILTTTTREIVAGGSSDNLAKWQNRKLLGPNLFSKTVEAKIRLDRNDIAAFRLSWIL